MTAEHCSTNGMASSAICLALELLALCHAHRPVIENCTVPGGSIARGMDYGSEYTEVGPSRVPSRCREAAWVGFLVECC